MCLSWAGLGWSWGGRAALQKVLQACCRGAGSDGLHCAARLHCNAIEWAAERRTVFTPGDERLNSGTGAVLCRPGRPCKALAPISCSPFCGDVILLLRFLLCLSFFILFLVSVSALHRLYMVC